MVIGEKIKKLRELKNYSQEYVANQLGISQNVYGRIERGIQDLTIDRLNRIAHIFEVKPQDLLYSEVTFGVQENNSIGRMGGVRTNELNNYFEGMENSHHFITLVRNELGDLVKQNMELIQIIREKF